MILSLALLATLSGPADCRFAVPADMHSGPAQWLGPCSANLANGIGVLRVALPTGKAELFYGVFRQGEPVRGIFGDSDGGFSNPTHGFSPRTGHSVDDNYTSNPAGQDASLWVLAASAARVAARHYENVGNKASAEFYRARAKELSRGPAE